MDFAKIVDENVGKYMMSTQIKEWSLSLLS